MFTIRGTSATAFLKRVMLIMNMVNGIWDGEKAKDEAKNMCMEGPNEVDGEIP